jgi:capsular polysaccharide biosynthesis protein
LGNSEWASTSPQIFGQIRKALLRAYQGTSGPTPERIYISRNRIAFKRLVNEEQLLPVIQKHSFDIVQPENMSLSQQVRTFSMANIILAAHGSGITNMIFSPTNAQVLELQDARFAPRRWYWKVASILGHEYSTMIGPVTGSRYEGDTDFTIDPVSLKQYLETSLSPADGKPKVQWWVSR